MAMLPHCSMLHWVLLETWETVCRQSEVQRRCNNVQHSVCDSQGPLQPSV